MTTTTSIYEGRVLVTFNEAKHTYTVRVPELTEKKLWFPSITGVLSVMEKAALIPWAAGQVRQYAEKRFAEIARSQSFFQPQEVSNVLAEAEECWKELSKATTIGSLAHRHLHEELKYRSGLRENSPSLTLEANTILQPGISQEMIELANLSIKAGLEFLEENRVEPLMFERVLFSPTHGFIGTADLIARVNGTLSVLDWKTSKAIYPSMFLQLAAYQCCYMEEFPEQTIQNRIVVNIKKDGSGFEFEQKGLESYTEDLEAFLACNQLYRWNRENDKYKKGAAVQALGPLPKLQKEIV